MDQETLSVKLIRRHCLECAGGSPKYVLWYPNDGAHSTRCGLWPFRFGVRPETFRQRYGPRLLAPETMPPATVNLDDLPPTVGQAATAEITVDGYHQPAVIVEPRKPRRNLTPDQRAAAVERLKRAREAKAADAA